MAQITLSPEQVQKLVSYGTDKIQAEINQTIGEIEEQELQTIFESAVNQYYGAYSPKYYHRKKDFYDILETKVLDTGFEATMSSSNLSGHRVSNEYIYLVMFKHGFHGGAWSGDETHFKEGLKMTIPHPSPGVPYWRTWPYFYYWSRPAFYSEAPFNAIVSMWNAWVDEHDNDTWKTNIAMAIIYKYI